MEKNLTFEEIKRIEELIEEYRKIYVHATRIGKQIEDLQGEMVKVAADMQNKSDEEREFYKQIAERLEIDIEEARSFVLQEIQKNMNQSQTTIEPA